MQVGLHVFDVCLAGLALYLASRLFWKKSSTPLPPGPHGWPLIGNLFDFPTYAPYKTFTAMSRKYGPVIFFNVLGARYVVLNSFKTTNDLLEKKSAVTANRARLTMGGDLVGWNDATVFLQYDDTYRKHRKLFQRQIGTKSSVQVFYPAEEEEAKQLIRSVLKNPDNLIAHCQRTASSVILRISHGHSVKEDDDPLVEMVDKAMQIFTTVMTPGRFLVDTFPILRHLPVWFPGGGFHQDARRWRKIVRETADTPHQLVLEHLAKGDALPSLTSQLLQEGLTSGEEEILKWASFSLYAGGSNTTSSALTAFFLAMAIYPEVQKKAQAEVDAVLGNKRLPTMEDRDALPYVNAICKELLRWHVLVPMPPHAAARDIVYEGYFIPKGTVILPNIWSILRDPERYPDPDVFDPERFFGKNQQPDPNEVCFGWGRRRCPGVLLGESAIFICAAVALATMNVSRCVENGVEIVPEYDVVEDMICHVKPFKCKIGPRSKKTVELLRA